MHQEDGSEERGLMVRSRERATCHKGYLSGDCEHVPDARCVVAWVALRGNERAIGQKLSSPSHSPCHSLAAVNVSPSPSPRLCHASFSSPSKALFSDFLPIAATLFVALLRLDWPWRSSLTLLSTLLELVLRLRSLRHRSRSRLCTTRCQSTFSDGRPPSASSTSAATSSSASASIFLHLRSIIYYIYFLV